MDANSVNYVVRLDKTNTIYFKNITIQNDSLNRGCIIQARGGDKLKFSNCVLEFSGPAATGTSSLNKIIHVTNSYNPNSSVTTFYNSIEIDSCIFNNGYSAFDGSFTNTTCQIFLRNNTINNPSAYGVYSTSNGTFKILGNRFTMRNNGSNSSILIFNFESI
ncbi:MAG: hypothetical protein IPK03_02580 [Bacteroidetes bacterium]|nr:hypothetical protein [Bacteroidota bacterium]